VRFKQVGALKAKHPTWTAGNAFPAGQAVAVFYRHTQPGMVADIDVDGAVIRTDPALHTAGGLRDYITLGQGSSSY